MKSILVDYAYAEEDIKLEELIGKIFLQNGKRFALAESCYRRIRRSSCDQHRR
jgi:hypothetical protein